MKVAVDFQSASGQRTGIGVFTKTIIETMQRLDPGIEFILYSPKTERDLNVPARIWWESVRIPLKNLANKPDLIYSPGFSSAVWSSAPRVVTVHDVIGAAFPSNQKGASRFYWSRWQPMALKKAQRIVASSLSTRADLEKYLQIPASKVAVVPLAAKPHFKPMTDRQAVEQVLNRHGLRRPYFICVGTLEPRKNILNLIKAYEIFRKRRAEVSLLIIGKPGGAEREIDDYLQKSKVRGVYRLGYVSDEDLVGLYNGALGYAMLSLYEGFGYPVLEAMCCGLSGLASNRSSIPEIAADTAISVDPVNIGEIAAMMERFVSDDLLRNRLAVAAQERSHQFSLEHTAGSMIKIFKEMAAKHS